MELICLPGQIESGDRDLSVSDWLRIGCRAGQGRKQVGLAAAPDCPEECLLAVTAGILSTGADSWDFGRMTLPEFYCCVGSSRPSLALMLLPPRSARVFSPEGEVLFPLKKHFARPKRSGTRVSMENLRALYPISLLRSAAGGLEGMSARFSGGMLGKVLEEAFCQLGGKLGGDTLVRLGAEGQHLSLFQREELLWEGEAPGGDGPAQALRMLACLNQGRDCFLREFGPAPEKLLLLPEKRPAVSST